MRSLRMRVFVTVAIVLAAATVVSGLLSRRATLIEERQILGPRRLPPLDGVDCRHPDGVRIGRLVRGAARARGRGTDDRRAPARG